MTQWYPCEHRILVLAYSSSGQVDGSGLVLITIDTGVGTSIIAGDFRLVKELGGAVLHPTGQYLAYPLEIWLLLAQW